MPIYQYKCGKSTCEEVVEVIQKMSDDPLVECPKCGNDTLQKQICARTVIKMTGLKP